MRIYLTKNFQRFREKCLEKLIFEEDKTPYSVRDKFVCKTFPVVP